MNRLLSLVILMALSTPVTAFAADDGARWSLWYNMGNFENCSAAPINAAVVCGGTRGIKVEGYNVVTLEISYTWASGSGWQYYLETCYEGHASTDCTDAVDWHRVSITQATPGTGITLTADPVVHAAGASGQVTYSFGINYKRIRLAGFVSSGSPGAGDKITVHGIANQINAF